MRWIIVIAAFLLLTDASFAQEKQTARPEVGQPVAQAGELLKAKKYKEALQKLAAADAVPDKTPYERYVIEGTRAAIDLNSGDQRGAIKALDAVLATGILSPQDALIRIQALVQLDYQVKDYPQTIAAANRYYQQGGTADEPRLLQAQNRRVISGSNDLMSADGHGCDPLRRTATEAYAREDIAVVINHLNRSRNVCGRRRGNEGSCRQQTATEERSLHYVPAAAARQA